MSKILALAEAAGLKLRRQGNQFTGLCPFHAEKTPSFSISHRREAFHCFSCGAQGGYVEFAKQLGLSLDEVLGPLHDGRRWIEAKKDEIRVHRRPMPWDEPSPDGRRCEECGSSEHVADNGFGRDLCGPCWADRRIDIDILWGQVTGHYPEVPWLTDRQRSAIRQLLASGGRVVRWQP